MGEFNYRSLRLLVDMQACQTEGSELRGVGRYSHAFFCSLVAEAQRHDILAHLATQLPVTVTLNGLPESRVLRSRALPAWSTDRDFRGGEQDTLDALAVSASLASAKADIIHVSHVFEGFGKRVALPSISRRVAGQVISATLYDLIPLLFQGHYFQDEGCRKWYRARMAWLRQADLLLAISESSRQDAIALLGIEPWRIVTIHGGISSHFAPPKDRQSLRCDLANRYGLREHFVLYTGGDDHRKNIRGAIAGYAEVPPEFRRNCQLVIVCAMSDERKRMYMKEARSAGLLAEDVVMTGFVPEADLMAFYGTCELFVFPSLYEGLGLPVLEAMACGAPVIGGNNSSIKELIARSDALFDATSPQSIGAAIAKALSNKHYAESLSEYGMTRSKEFTWQRTATIALDAFEEAAKRSRESGVQCAVQGWLPRKRLAIFTPLPPCRSGIADYNARFLPYLARHFDIDLYVDNYKVVDEMLTSVFRIFNAQDFEAVASQYDAILYEFGNSEFHAHMLPLLECHPGIVGLHDAYLSGLFGYLDFNLGMSGRYTDEMLIAHGTVARRYFAPVQKHSNAIGETMVRLPCTKRVLDQAIGVISHSPFNLHIARLHYPEGWQAPYRIIPQMVPIPQTWSENQRVVARRELGFNPDDFIITTFGHIAWTKWGDRLLESFLQSALGNKKNVHLVFAGELAKDDFAIQLEDAIRTSGKKDRVHITGFLSEHDYVRYLRITDVAIQLRTKSRGGTPKGVLDCLAYGVPVIVNNDASYMDYPDNVLIKLAADPSIEEIARVLELICTDFEQRKTYADSGLHYVQAHHDPPMCAAAYAAAINEFVERHQQTRIESHILAMAPHLSGCAQPHAAIQLASDWLMNVPKLAFRRRRLFIDVSHIAQSDHQTGIQRVVREIVRTLYCSEHAVIEPVAVELVDGNLLIAKGWLASQGLLLPKELELLAMNPIVEFNPGDVLLMLDSSWTRYREFFPVFERARMVRVPIYMVIYDLLPLTLPPGNFVEGGREWFAGWFHDAVAATDGLVCISRAVAADVATRLEAMHELKNRPNLGYWYLGADFAKVGDVGNSRREVSQMASRPYLLMVGTIEPRKSHALALSAMEKLWEEGHDLCLCIVGKEGWMVSELMKRIRQHPHIGNKLFLIEQACDADINALYAHASGLLFLSKGEGFGLPLVEAAHHGIPIICSDIPVFREIAKNFATYVSTDANILATELKEWWIKKMQHQLPDMRLMPRLTWEESCAMLLDVVINENWLRRNT